MLWASCLCQPFIYFISNKEFSVVCTNRNVAMLPEGATSEPATKFYPIGMRYLPASLQHKARDELGETEEKIETGMKILKERLQKNKVNFLEDDSHLLRFLRIRKFNYDKCFHSIKQYTQFASFFRQRIGLLDAEPIKKVLKHNGCGMLPYKDAEGRTILFYVTGKWDSGEHSPKHVVMTILVSMFLLMDDPATQVCGVVVIIDVKNLSMYEAQYFTECLRSLNIILRSDPGRFKRVDILNETALARFFIKIAKSFVPAKVSERITLFGSNTEELLQHYDSSVLPHEFGGNLGPLSNDHWIDKVDHLVNVGNDFIRRYTT